MEIKVYGRNVKVTDRLNEYVQSRAAKFEQLGNQVSDVEIKFSKDGHTGPHTIRVEITVTGSGPVLRAEASGADKFAVFDEAFGKLLERLRRARDRRKTHKISKQKELNHNNLESLTAPIEHLDSLDIPVEEAAFDDKYSLEDQVSSPIDIRRKSFAPARLSVAEAVDHMELVGHDFFVFIDSETDSPAAVYRRKGWSYGCITLDSSKD